MIDLRTLFFAATAALCSAFLLSACSASDSDDNNPDSSNCTVVDDQTFGADITLDDDCYLVPRTFTVTDGEVTVAAGTTVFFDPNTGLRFEDGARLDARGKSDARITFRGDQAQFGFWRGLFFEGDASHRIRHATFAHAGSRQWEPTELSSRGGLVVTGGAKLEAVDVAFESNEQAAISSTSPHATLNIDRTRFSDNDYPLRIHANLIDGLTRELSFSNNRRDAIYVHTDAPVTRSATWPSLDLPYRFEAPVPIHTSVLLAANTTFEFERHAGLDVDGGSLYGDASGAEPIRFIGTTDTAGHWRGLRFRDNSSPDNRLVNIAVLHAGSERWQHSWSNSQGSIVVHDNGYLHIDDALLAESDYHGISTRDAVVEGCDALRIEDVHRHDYHTYEGDEVCF